MKVIKTRFFNKQIKQLSKKYLKIEKDVLFFENNLNTEPFFDLWFGLYKYRIKNSSIPVWKRWGFRIIVKIYDDKVLPIFIYSKTQKENISEIEIIKWLEEVLKEL